MLGQAEASGRRVREPIAGLCRTAFTWIREDINQSVAADLSSANPEIEAASRIAEVLYVLSELARPGATWASTWNAIVEMVQKRAQEDEGTPPPDFPSSSSGEEPLEMSDMLPPS